MKKIQAVFARALGLRLEVKDRCGNNPNMPHWTWHLYHDL